VPASRGAQRGGGKALGRRSLEAMFHLSGWLLKVTLIGTALCLAYILYLILGGYLQTETRKVADAARLVGNGFAIFGLLLAVAVIVRLWDELAFALLVGVGGAAVTFGLPILMSTKGVNPNAGVARSLLDTTTLAGKLILAVALLRVIVGIVQYIREAPQREAERRLQAEREQLGPKKAQEATSRYGKCWQLPFCHAAIREVCPAYQARKTCWKFGRGCNCDPTMIEMMLRQGALKSGAVGAEQKRTQIEYMREELQASATAGTTERTIPCSKCPIYNEHQRQKFALVNPFIIVVTIVLFVIAFPVVMRAYGVVLGTLSKFAEKFIIQTGSVQWTAAQWFQNLDTPAVKVFFILIAFAFVFAYILKLVEWAIFVKKI